jgi:hypothetical protein
MKQFIGSTNNVGIRQTEEGIQPFVEVILLLTEPNYNAGLNGVDKTNQVSDCRFFASAKGLRTLAGHLEEMADEADNFMRHVKEKLNE